MSEYEAELDLPLLEKWCAHHRGEAVGDPYFATILMGVFLEGDTPRVQDFLKRFSQFYDSSLYDNLIRVADETRLTDPVEPWIHADIKAKRELFASDVDGNEIVKLIDALEFRYAASHDQWHDVLTASENHSLAYDIIGDYASGHVHLQELGDLIEPLYHICNSYDLAYAILAKMMKSPIDLSNYFEVYLRGSDYLFDDDSILVIKHAHVG